MSLVVQTSIQTIYIIPSLIAEQSKDKSITPELVSIIKKLPAFLVENKKTARRFIAQLQLDIYFDSLHWYELTKDTSAQEVKAMFDEIQKLGLSDIGLLSDAGCPGIADPGSLAIQYAHQHNIKVVPLVGPSSILLALMASGLNGQSFVFHGYIPIPEDQRSRYIKSMEKDSIQNARTQIFIETPYRNHSVLKTILATCHPRTKLCIASNMTASDEYIRTSSIAEWIRNPIDLSKKPTVFLIGQ